MDLFSIIFGLLSLAEKMVERGAQSGELSDAQKTVLQDKSVGIFGKYKDPAPPPPSLVK